MIKAIYHNGSNGPVKVNISKVKTYKRVADMSSQEIIATGFGMFR